MKHARAILVAAAMLAGPATAGAQVTNHVSWQMGLAAGGYPSWTVPGIGLGYEPFGLRRGIGFGFGLGVSVGIGFGVYDDYRGGYRHGFPGHSHCWDAYYDPFLYDPFLDCWGVGPFGYSPFGWYGWETPWWRPFGFLGWPSRRYLARHYYSWAPGWTHGWGPSWSYAWARSWSHYPYGLYGGRYWGYGNWDDDWRYRSRVRYAYDGYGGRSPLFGPQFKEPPVYVTDNGPERPVATLRPRGPNATLDDINSRRGRSLDGAAQLRGVTDVRKARPRNQPGARTAIPRPSTRGTPGATRRPSPLRGTPPKVRKRPDAVTTGQPTPTRRPAPQTRSTPSRRPQPAVRTPGPRRIPTTLRASPPKRQPTTRTAPPRRTPSVIRTAPRRPAVRSTAPRRSPPKVQSSAPRRSPPKARPAPRRSPPKARPAPKRPASRAPAKRSAPPRRRGG